jgi:hypothetical protein
MQDTTTEMTEASETIQDSIPASLEAAFAETFAAAEEDDLYVQDLATLPPPVTPGSKAVVAQRRQEEREELEQEGLESPDAAGDTPVVETEQPAEEAAVVEETVAETPAEPAAAGLDPNLRLVAQSFGWTDAKIDALLAADRELAEQTFTQLADAYTNLSRQFTGTPASPVAPATQDPATATQSQAPASGLDALYANLESFADANGEELVEKFLKPLQAEVIQPLRQMQASMEASYRQQVANEAQTAITRLAGDFGSLYGAGNQRSAEQQAQVTKLATLADQVRAGAKMQGQELSVTEAINRAHLILSADLRVAEGRKQVTAQVQKRAKTITARPTMRRQVAAVAAKGDEAAAGAVGAFWANLGEDAE